MEVDVTENSNAMNSLKPDIFLIKILDKQKGNIIEKL